MPHSPPSIATCLELMEEYSMLANIRVHSFMVARVAEAIYTHISEHTYSALLPQKALVIAGALLHDIAKTRCLEHHCDHARVGADICRHHGYSDIAEIVNEHVYLQEYATERYKKGEFLAKEIVFYADKRVKHDQIVDLDMRLQYILERYGNNDELRHRLIRENFKNCQELERHLCKSVGSTPESLLKNIITDPFINNNNL